MKKIFSFFCKTFYIIFLFASFSFFGASFSYANEANDPNKAKTEGVTISKEERDKAQKFILKGTDVVPQESIAVTVDTANPMVGFLTIIQRVLLQLILPVVAVGCGLYIAYELFTADGDEAKMSSAWKAILYSVVAIICIGLSALIVSVISGLSIG